MKKIFLFPLFVMMFSVAVLAVDVPLGGEIFSNVTLPSAIDIGSIKIGETYEKTFNVSGSFEGGHLNISFINYTEKVSVKVVDPLDNVKEVPLTGVAQFINGTAGLWKIAVKGELVGTLNETLRFEGSDGLNITVE